MFERITTLTDTIEKLNENIEKQNESIEQQNKRIEYLEIVNRHQEEIIAARNRRLFGRKSEKMSYDESQYWLFNEIEAIIREKINLPEKTIIVNAHKRVKQGRKPISDNLPRVEIIHDIPEAEKKCTLCPKMRPRIGEDIREEVSIVPMKVFVKRHIEGVAFKQT